MVSERFESALCALRRALLRTGRSEQLDERADLWAELREVYFVGFFRVPSVQSSSNSWQKGNARCGQIDGFHPKS